VCDAGPIEIMFARGVTHGWIAIVAPRSLDDLCDEERRIRDLEDPPASTILTSSPTLTRLEKLRIAAFTAPRLRNESGRRIKVANARGEVVREISVEEAIIKIHERAGVEFDVVHSAKAKTVRCATCPTWFTPVRRKPGPLPVQCEFCRTGRGQTECPGYGEHKCSSGPGDRPAWPPPRNAFTPRRVLARGNGPWRCTTCALRLANADEQVRNRRSETAKQIHARRSPEERKEIARRVHESTSPERRSTAAKKAASSRSAEERSESVRKSWAKRNRTWKWK